MAATTIQTPAPIRGVRITPMGKPTFQLPPQRPQTPTSYFKSPFDPSRHLAYNAMPSRHTMSEIGYENTGVSQIAVSEPFELFTPEAVRTMRNEVLSDEVWDNCRFASSIAACQLRGMAPKYAKFVYDAWMNPETLRIISGVAGVELVPVMEYEIGHINISVNDDPDGKTQAAPVVGWHKDSYPFVCVLMLSDATEMKGGETALRTGSGDIMKVRGPQMGSAVVLQGKYIDHIALPSTNARERITIGDAGWYGIRSILWAVDYELPKTVTALPGAVLNEAGVILSCGAALHWEDGKVATFHCSFLAHLTMDITAIGTAGTLHLNDFIIPFGEKEASFTTVSKSGFTDLVTGWVPVPSQHTVTTDLPQEACMVSEFARLVGNIKANGAKPDPKWPSISRKTQLVLDAVTTSIAQGSKPVEI